MLHLLSSLVERQRLTLPGRSPHPGRHIPSVSSTGLSLDMQGHGRPAPAPQDAQQQHAVQDTAHLPAGLDILTVLGAHEGEGLVVEHDAAVAGSGSALLRDKGQRVDAKIVEVALFFQQEMLGAGQDPPAAPGQPAAPLQHVLGQVQEHPCVPSQQGVLAGQAPPAERGSLTQEAAVPAVPTRQQQAGLSGTPAAGQEPTASPQPGAAVHGQCLGATTPPAQSLQQAAWPGQELSAGQAHLPAVSDQPTAGLQQGHLEGGHQEAGPEAAGSGNATEQPAVGLAGSQTPALAGSAAAAAAAAEQGLCGFGGKQKDNESSEGNTASTHPSVDSTTPHGAPHRQVSQRSDNKVDDSAARLQQGLAADAEAGAEADSVPKVPTERGPSQSQQTRLGPDFAAAAGAAPQAAQESLQNATSLQQQQGLASDSFLRVAPDSSPLPASGSQQQQESRAGQPGLGSGAALQSAQPLQAASPAGQQAGAPLPQQDSAQQPSRLVAHQAAAAERPPLPAQPGSASTAAPNRAVKEVPAEGSPAPARRKQAAWGADEKQWPVLLLSNDNAQLQLAKSHG